ncbi:MAG: hypothetical protein JNL90_10885 [Planctomycetes bacterium]|nr:hypothetical protein [Planctomycetota bacterium]
MIRSAALRSAAACLALTAIVAAEARADGWQWVTIPPSGQTGTALLLMDGRVLVSEILSNDWILLTPDSSGSYVNGTWSDAADSIHDRAYFASALLRDGRVLIAGGEVSWSGGQNTVEIYDPLLDQWTAASRPSWPTIESAPGTVLPDGRFFMGHINDRRCAIYDPDSDSWSAATDNPRSRGMLEGWTLLPDGTVLKCDVFGHPQSHLYDSTSDAWTILPNTPVDLVGAVRRMGPMIVRNDGSCIVFGATQYNCSYTPAASPGGIGTWAQLADYPTIGGSYVTATHSSAVLLPNGNVFCALGLYSKAPTYFFGFDGTTFTRAPDAPGPPVAPYLGHLLLLPSGEVLYTNGDASIYSPDGAPDPSWKPAITAVPRDLIPGTTYRVEGTQLNGRSNGSSYANGAGVATHYPLVRLRFENTGHVVYCRAFEPSTMGYATGSAIHSTRFVVPSGETGPALLEVCANGIASDGVHVTVRDPIAIDFDALATGTVVTQQYAEATFSAESGHENVAIAATAGASGPNMLATAPIGGLPDGTHSTTLDFPCPVASLTFAAIGVDSVGPAATVDVWSGGALAGSVAVTGAGTPSVPVVVDLTAFTEVTRLELHSITDVGGVGWDDFRFCEATTAAWSNYGVGWPGALGVPNFTCRTPPAIGTTLTAELENSAGVSTIAVVLLGVQQAQLPTRKGGDFLVLPLLSFTLPLAPGVTAIDADLDDDPTLCGLEFFAQALELDSGASGGLSFTPGLKLVLGN